MDYTLKLYTKLAWKFTEDYKQISKRKICMTIFYKVRTTTFKLNDINKQRKSPWHLQWHKPDKRTFTPNDTLLRLYRRGLYKRGLYRREKTIRRSATPLYILIKSLSVRMSCRSLFAYLTFHMNILRVVDHLLTVNVFYWNTIGA